MTDAAERAAIAKAFVLELHSRGVEKITDPAVEYHLALLLRPDGHPAVKSPTPSVSEAKTVTGEEFDRDPKAVYEAAQHAPVTVLDSQGRPSMTVVTPSDVVDGVRSSDAKPLADSVLKVIDDYVLGYELNVDMAESMAGAKDAVFDKGMYRAATEIRAAVVKALGEQRTNDAPAGYATKESIAARRDAIVAYDFGGAKCTCGAPRGSDHGITCPAPRSDASGELPHDPSELLEELRRCHLVEGAGCISTSISAHTYQRLIAVLSSLTGPVAEAPETCPDRRR